MRELSEFDQFLEMACLAYASGDGDDRRQIARDIFERNPNLANESLFHAAALNDADAVKVHLVNGPGTVNESGGPRDWPPLLYLCYSRVHAEGANPTMALQALLQAGADPNAYWLWDNTYRFTALTGVFGRGEQGSQRLPPHPGGLVLAEMLLEAGADPNDGQGLYNTMFDADDAVLALLLRFGLNADHKVNWIPNNPPGSLDYLMRYAVGAGQAERAQLLLRHGADPNHREDNGWTLLQKATRLNRPAIARMLREAGANDSVTPIDDWLGLVLAGDQKKLEKIGSDNPDFLANLSPADREILHEACSRGLVQSVAYLLDLGFDINALQQGGARATPLHQAAWHGQVEVVQLLLNRGADPSIRDPYHNATPKDWAEYNGQADSLILMLD